MRFTDHPVQQHLPMSLTARLPLVLALLLVGPLASGQTNLGELLDAGGKRLSAEQFKREVVQRTVVGPTPTGAIIEIMYAANGTIHGLGPPAGRPQSLYAILPIAGEWTIDATGRICTAFQSSEQHGGSVPIRPMSCQAWFKLRDQFWLSDSDSDRSAKVFPRKPKE
jgi:hypothetical protein